MKILAKLHDIERQQYKGNMKVVRAQPISNSTLFLKNFVTFVTFV